MDERDQIERKESTEGNAEMENSPLGGQTFTADAQELEADLLRLSEGLNLLNNNPISNQSIQNFGRTPTDVNFIDRLRQSGTIDPDNNNVNKSIEEAFNQLIQETTSDPTPDEISAINRFNESILNSNDQNNNNSSTGLFIRKLAANENRSSGSWQKIEIPNQPKKAKKEGVLISSHKSKSFFESPNVELKTPSRQRSRSDIAAHPTNTTMTNRNDIVKPFNTTEINAPYDSRQDPLFIMAFNALDYIEELINSGEIAYKPQLIELRNIIQQGVATPDQLDEKIRELCLLCRTLANNNKAESARKSYNILSAMVISFFVKFQRPPLTLLSSSQYTSENNNSNQSRTKFKKFSMTISKPFLRTSKETSNSPSDKKFDNYSSKLDKISAKLFGLYVKQKIINLNSLNTPEFLSLRAQYASKYNIPQSLNTIIKKLNECDLTKSGKELEWIDKLRTELSSTEDKEVAYLETPLQRELTYFLPTFMRAISKVAISSKEGKKLFSLFLTLQFSIIDHYPDYIKFACITSLVHSQAKNIRELANGDILLQLRTIYGHYCESYGFSKHSKDLWQPVYKFNEEFLSNRVNPWQITEQKPVIAFTCPDMNIINESLSVKINAALSNLNNRIPLYSLSDKDVKYTLFEVKCIQASDNQFSYTILGNNDSFIAQINIEKISADNKAKLTIETRSFEHSKASRSFEQCKACLMAAGLALAEKGLGNSNAVIQCAEFLNNAVQFADPLEENSELQQSSDLSPS